MPPKKNQNRSKKKNKKTLISGDAMAECVFPEDIMASILTRLPVKSILRFKSVCKPWFNLFSTPHFTKTHHLHFSQNPKNEAFIIYSISSENGNNHHHTMSLFNIESPTHQNPTNLNHPYPNIFADMDFVGCVNGMVCLSHPPFGEVVYLWNPALNLFKDVHFPEWDFEEDDMVSIGFGYDAVDEDFKVVRIVCFEDQKKKGKNGFEVYSCRSDSWTSILVGIDLGVFGTKNDAVVNGNPHWFEEYDNNGEILVSFFDVTKMVFNLVSPLSSPDVGGIENASLVDWNGSLALLAWKDTDERVSINVWVFDEGRKIWTVNYTFGPLELDVYELLQCSKNGRIFGECSDEKLFVFDSANGCVKEIVMYGAHTYPFDMFGYTESLACFKGMENVAVKKKKNGKNVGENIKVGRESRRRRSS